MKINKKKFFDGYRLSLDQHLTQKEVDAIDQFLDFVDAEITYFKIYEWAYVFATVYHETQYTFLPVIEAFRKSDAWRKRNFRYYPYFGRGYVQLTWLFNYIAFSKILGIDLVKNPELALQPDTSFRILIFGMKHGTFTKKSMSKYIKNDKPNYKSMRRVINGTDKADTIANYADEFLKILNNAIEK